MLRKRLANFKLFSIPKAKTRVSRLYFSNKSKTSKPDSRKWTKEFSRDPFVKKSRELDYRSRASFKLLEIESRFKLISKAKRILEIGCFPGGWSQILQEHAKQNTHIIGVDLLKTKSLPPKKGVVVEFLQGDALSEVVQGKVTQKLEGHPAQLIVCDIAPNFMGDLDIDHHNISEMNIQVLGVCEKFLELGGSLVIKTLHGTDEKKIFDLFAVNFKTVRRVKPGASRARSAELYYVGLGYKNTDFWRRVADIPAKDRSLEQIMDLMPEHLKMTPQEIKRARETLKYQIAHDMLDESKVTSPMERQFISAVKQEMKQENFEAKNKKHPVYTLEDLADMYEKHCEEHDYKYTYMKKVPRTLTGMLEEYEQQKPAIMKEIQEMLEMGKNPVTL